MESLIKIWNSFPEIVRWAIGISVTVIIGEITRRLFFRSAKSVEISQNQKAGNNANQIQIGISEKKNDE